MSQQMPARAVAPPCAARIQVFALTPPREELYRRINERTEAHFAAGLVDEVQRLLYKGVPAQSNALGAHSYRRVVEYLKGKRDLNSAIEQSKLDVRHYSKRQLTWFRREPETEWVEGFGQEASVQEQVFHRLKLLIERQP